jgi:predicted esterase
MKENHFETKRTARYYSLGNCNENTENVWIVLHGYMQPAKFFLKQFELFKNSKTYIVAPEALSRAYVSGVSGKVGASWMTKEDREKEISDYVFYLNSLSNQILSKVPVNCKIKLLGFSQGVAALCRWYAQSNISAEQIILWCGTFPIDMQFYHGNKKWKNIHLVSASNDIYITPEKKQEQKKILHNIGIKFTAHEFEGKHEIHLDVLKKIITN